MGRQTWGGIAGGPCRTIKIVVLGVRLGERPAPSGTTMNTAGAASIKPMFRLTSLLKVKSARGMVSGLTAAGAGRWRAGGLTSQPAEPW